MNALLVQPLRGWGEAVDDMLRVSPGVSDIQAFQAWAYTKRDMVQET
jgi:hypothetical protein